MPPETTPFMVGLHIIVEFVMKRATSPASGYARGDGDHAHVARARGVSHRHACRDAHLHRSVPRRQPLVPRERAISRALRPRRAHARPRRPRGRHARAREALLVPRRRSGRASWVALHQGPRPGHGPVAEQGRHGPARRHADHADGREPLDERIRERDVHLPRRALRARPPAGRRPVDLHRGRHERVRGHGAHPAPLRPRRRGPPDRRPLHDGARGGGGRGRARRLRRASSPRTTAPSGS